MGFTPHCLVLVLALVASCGLRTPQRIPHGDSTGSVDSRPDADGRTDTLVPADGARDAYGPQDPPDAAADRRMPADTGVPVDTRPIVDARESVDTRPLVDARESVDTRPIVDTRESVDAKLADAARDTAADTGARPADPVVYAAKDLGTASAACRQATDEWLTLVAQFAEEDRRCWRDSDCRAIGWPTSCGLVCPFAMNNDRAGEFNVKVGGYAFDHCKSCPQVTYPACPAMRATFCNAGRCEYVPQSTAALISAL